MPLTLFVRLCPFRGVSLASTLRGLVCSCLPLSRSLSTLLITFIAYTCTLCLLSNRVGKFIKWCRREQGRDVVELTLMKSLIGQWFQSKLQCHSWNNVKTHFTTYYKRKTTQQQKLITLCMLPWDPFTLTGSAGYWMFSSHWAEIIRCFAGRVGLPGSRAPFCCCKNNLKRRSRGLGKCQANRMQKAEGNIKLTASKK